MGTSLVFHLFLAFIIPLEDLIKSLNNPVTTGVSKNINVFFVQNDKNLFNDEELTELLHIMFMAFMPLTSSSSA